VHRRRSRSGAAPRGAATGDGIGKDAATYRYCPVYELPADLRKAAR